ncbi:unnamed protein product [Cladocopium goreaui]|uniref:Tyrosine-protein kinase ephrin type A/B receptor-like domain-containing protein n=1 Tax=Cladocopium goreaui TaxID=2562237 RepID=A0A9P1C9E5_9DINO|nr:unnamed protein product [Cladocopium goreaui]
MSSTALVPYICYAHPNGLRSNLKYTNVFCRTDEHTAMVIAGSLLLAFGVCGFWGFAAYLAHMCPKWCSTGNFRRVQRPLLALTVVVAPDYPAVQCLACQIILMTFMAVQIYNWPWKAPILNVVDMVVCFLLVILVAVAGFYVPAVTDGLKTFFEVFNIVALSGLLVLVGVMILASVLALFYRAAIGSQQELKIMTVGKTPPPSQVASVLVRQIAALVSKSDEQMAAKLEKLGVYDLQALQLASSILQNEVVDATDAIEPTRSSRSTSRITSQALAPAPKKKAEPEPPKPELDKDDEDPNKAKQATV